MSLVKSFSVGHGAMYFVEHNSSNFTLIDCRLTEGATMKPIIDEIVHRSVGKGIVRFISTHPDDDHIKGIIELDEAMSFLNFYCVKNAATREDPTDAFEHYRTLRDSSKAFYVERGCKRRWMNQNDEVHNHGNSGINFQWPITSNQNYKDALGLAADGGRANNISPIFTYSLNGGVSVMWMGDLETDFMEAIKDEITDLPEVDVLFAPHHGRDTPPKEWMDQLNPQIVVLGDAAKEHLDPYTGYTKVSQRLSDDLTFDCIDGKTHIYAANPNYKHNDLDREAGMSDVYGKYVGTLQTPRA